MISVFTQRLKLDVPIVQGPFGGGLSSVALASAVSNLGGLGSYGAHHLSPDGVTAVINQLRAATPRTFSVNFWVSNHDDGGLFPTREQYDRIMAHLGDDFHKLGIPIPPPPERIGWSFEEQIDAAIEAAPPAISFVFGVPPAAIVEACRRAGIVTIGTATSPDEAVAIESAGLDCVVASGSDAGGHRPSFLRDPERSLIGTFSLIPQIVDRVRIPVVAAGGIADARGVRAALTLGAEAAQIGTAFLACEESGAHPAHRSRLFGANSEATVLSRAFTGRLARFIENEFIEQSHTRSVPSLPFPALSWGVGFLKNAAFKDGRESHMPLYAGQGTPLLNHRTAGDLMRELTKNVC